MNYDNKLYIIGNGFDQHHEIESGYKDFKIFIESNDKALFDLLENYFDNGILWSDFEEALADLNIDTIIDEASDYLVDYGADDWSDAYHHDYQYEIQERIDIVTKKLKQAFTRWILQLEGVIKDIDYTLDLVRDAAYLTFNYTTTLETVYGIPTKNILHIHNKIIDENSILILGHSRKPEKNVSFDDTGEIDEDIEDVRVIEGNDMLDNYFVETYKSTEKLIVENQEFFQNLKSIKEIHILGHSLKPVDLGYFDEIIKNIDVEKVKWKVSYHTDEDLYNHQATLINIGIDKKLLEFQKLSKFGIFQNSLTLF